MEPAHRIDAETAYLVGHWTDDLLPLLESERPSRLELVGDWPDLSPFAPVGASVRSLHVSGTVETGRIERLAHLDVFSRLESLVLTAKVKRGFDATGLTALREADLPWQPEVTGVLGIAALRHLTLRAYAGEDAQSLPGHPGLTSLWLATPAVRSMRGLRSFPRLARLRLTRARKLETLDGVQGSALTSIDIDDARALRDLSALRNLPLQRLALRSVARTASLKDVLRLDVLRELVIGGTDAPDLDWPAALQLPHVTKVAAWWDPVRHPEALLHATVSSGRIITRFDPVPGKGRRALIIELGAPT